MSIFSDVKNAVISRNHFDDEPTRSCSVIIPAHNAEKTIVRTLASLISNRDYIKEVIIVNDRCSDGTVKRALEFQGTLPLRVVNNRGNHNPGAARYTGLLEAKSEWITFVDSDDCLTPSCLYYVDDYLDDDVVLLHCQSIYYESGSFEPDSIGHDDLSCGGNFYRREYLLKHKLFPHPDLKMSEDEYFNQKVDKYIRYCDKERPKIEYYDYPVYEVHHDVDEGKSFALSNWVEYVIKYHLLCQQYIIDEFHTYIQLRNTLVSDYVSVVIFAYFALFALLEDDEEEVNVDEQKGYMRDFIEHCSEVLRLPEDLLVSTYENNPDFVQGIISGVEGSTGISPITTTVPFRKFINSL